MADESDEEVAEEDLERSEADDSELPDADGVPDTPEDPSRSESDELGANGPPNDDEHSGQREGGPGSAPRGSGGEHEGATTEGRTDESQPDPGRDNPDPGTAGESDVDAHTNDSPTDPRPNEVDGGPVGPGNRATRDRADDESPATSQTGEGTGGRDPRPVPRTDGADETPKGEPTDPDRNPDEMGLHGPNTMDPDDGDEMTPPDPGGGPPFDPDDVPAVDLEPDQVDADAPTDNPPSGHQAVPTRPEELSDGNDADPAVTSADAAESDSDPSPDAGPEMDGESEPTLGPEVEQVEQPPGQPDVQQGHPQGGEQLGQAPITEPDYDTPDYDEEWDTTPKEPPDDKEMPLADHIEEMVHRGGIVLLTVAVGTAVSFIFAEFILMAMWYGLVPIDSSPHVYGPLEKILAEIKVASLGGVLIALPVLVYESYLFMRPGLYPKERRYYLAAIPTSLVLGGIGMLFSYFLVLPVLFEYFIYYSEDGVDLLAFGLQVTFDLIVTLLWAFALVFQIPLLIMLAIMMGVTTREWLESKRIYFWGGFIAVGFFLGGIDPTSVAGMIIAATMIGLFEGTLAILRWAKGDLPWRNRSASS